MPKPKKLSVSITYKKPNKKSMLTKKLKNSKNSEFRLVLNSNIAWPLKILDWSKVIQFKLQGPQEHNSVAGSDGGESNRGGSSASRNHRDINKNLMHVAELKKLNTRFYSEVLRKKFFVLYEDSRQSLTNPRDHHSDVSFKSF